MRTAILAIASALAMIASPASVSTAQTTVVQNPNGGTSTVTVQSDGSGQTIMLMQNVVGDSGQAAPAPPGSTGGVVSIIGPPGPDGGAPAVPLPFQPRDPSAPLPTGTSILRGRVTAADSGRPIRRATVRVSSPGARETRTVSTDQNGRWELKELPAGSYTVTATRTGYVPAGFGQPRPSTPPRPVTVADREARESVDIALLPAGVITGRIVDEFGDPVSEAIVGAQRLQYAGGARRPVMAGSPSSTNDIGEFRLYGLQPGSYYVTASPRGISNPFDTPADRVAYAQTYYPSATDIANAQRVSVRSGETVTGLVVSLTPAHSARITGTVYGADGSPARSGAVILSSSASPIFLSSNGMIRPDGTFTLNNVPPGNYTLRTTVGGPGATPGPPVFSTADVSVNGSDIEGVVLQPRVPITLAGRLVGDPSTLAAINPSRVRFMAASISPQPMPGPTQPPQPLSPDLTFTMQAMPGQISIRPLSLPDLVVRAVRIDGIDVTRGFTLAPGAVPGSVEVEVVASTSKVVVTAQNSRGDAAPDRDVIVFPQDEADWGVSLPGHGATGRTNEQGTFETPVLLPGAYYVVLGDDLALEPGDANDPDILTQLRARAQRVTVREGETATVTLRTSDR